MYHTAQWYDPGITQTTQPDTIVPDPYNSLDYQRYAYVRYNPLKYSDPSGHRVCDYDCQVEYEDADPAYEHYCEDCEWDPNEQKQNEELAEAIITTGTETVASVMFEPADWAYTAYHCANGDCSPWMLAGLLPLIPGSAGRYIDDFIEAGGGVGYTSFRQLKKSLGGVGDGNALHHIVEQSQIKKSGFSPQQIHNIKNVLAIDAETHRKISGFYSSNIAGPGTQRVRDWLAGQSYAAQYQFGIQVLQKFGLLR